MPPFTNSQSAQIAGYVRFVGVILLWVKVLVFGF
jgi:hypothetical protein